MTASPDGMRRVNPPPSSSRSSGCLKVLTQEESLRRINSQENFWRRSSSSVLGGPAAGREMPESCRRLSSVELGYVLRKITPIPGLRSSSVSTAVDCSEITADENREKQADSQEIVLDAKKVTFCWLQFRLYKTVADVNPSVTKGPGLGLGWHFTESERVDVQQYEDGRPVPRVMRELMLSVQEKEDRLRASGASRAEIVAVTKRINIARKKRRRTLQRLEPKKGVAIPRLFGDRAEEKMELTKHWLQRSLGMREASARAQDKLWSDAANRETDKDNVSADRPPLRSALKNS